MNVFYNVMIGVGICWSIVGIWYAIVLAYDEIKKARKRKRGEGDGY